MIKSCSFSVFDPHLSQPNTFFFSDRPSFIYVDKDVVDITNLNRQLIADTSTVGKPKVEVEKESW